MVQANFCQKHLFFRQLTHNMKKKCSLIYQFEFSTWKLQAQTCCVHNLFWMSKQKQKNCVHSMFSPCSERVVFMYWTGKSMNIFFSYCGLVDVRINVSDKYLSVPVPLTIPFNELPWYTDLAPEWSSMQAQCNGLFLRISFGK